MSFIEQIMQVCDRVLAKAEQQKGDSPCPDAVTSQANGAQINSPKKVH